MGIVQPDYTASASMLTSGIAYPASLTEKVMKEAADSDIVKQQMACLLYTSVVGGTAAAARLGDEQGRVLEVVLAAVQRIEELANRCV